MKSVTLTLQFPPSTNTYWRRVGNKTLLSRRAREYRALVMADALTQGAPRLGQARVRVSITLHAPDNRRRDLDNFGGKALLDALVHARVLDDDSQVDALHVIRGAVRKPGSAVVTLEPIS